MLKLLFSLLAALFFALGTIGLMLPVIPQVPFFLAGVLFLSAASKRFKHRFLESTIYRKYIKEHALKHERIRKLLQEDGSDGSI